MFFFSIFDSFVVVWSYFDHRAIYKNVELGIKIFNQECDTKRYFQKLNKKFEKNFKVLWGIWNAKRQTKNQLTQSWWSIFHLTENWYDKLSKFDVKSYLISLTTNAKDSNSRFMKELNWYSKISSFEEILVLRCCY